MSTVRGKKGVKREALTLRQEEAHKASKRRQTEVDVVPTKLDFTDATVPVALYRLLAYDRTGKKSSPPAKAIAEWIKKNNEVPSDFETSHRFGPLSGLSREDRLIRAYAHNLFPLSQIGHDKRPTVKHFLRERDLQQAADFLSQAE